MKRVFTACLLVVLIVGLSGLVPATSAQSACQVSAVGQSKSCSIVSDGQRMVYTLIIGRGNVTVTYPGAEEATSICSPATRRDCVGLWAVAPAGVVFTMTVDVGAGRMQSGPDVAPLIPG